MKILSLSKEGNLYGGWAEMNDEYVGFTFDAKTNDVNIYDRYPIGEFNHNEYSNYFIFASRMIRHGMEIEFLEEPIEIKELSKKELERTMKVINSV